MTTGAPGGGPVGEERRKTVVTVQWPPEDGREDDIQTTYGPWYVVRDTCWKEALSTRSHSSTYTCTYGGYHGTHYTQKVITKSYVRPIPANLPALTTLQGPSVRVSDWDNCNAAPSYSSGGGGGSSSDDGREYSAYTSDGGKTYYSRNWRQKSNGDSYNDADKRTVSRSTRVTNGSKSGETYTSRRRR